jgi:hypothetical protein
MHSCEICGKGFGRPADLTRHRGGKSCKIKCPRCNKVFGTKKALNGHTRVCKPDGAPIHIHLHVDNLNLNVEHVDNIENLTVVVKKWLQADLAHIGADLVYKALNSKETGGANIARAAIGTIAEKIWTDEEHPQNRTVMLGDVEGAALVSVGDDKWEERSVDQVVSKMYEKTMNVALDARRQPFTGQPGCPPVIEPNVIDAVDILVDERDNPEVHEECAKPLKKILRENAQVHAIAKRRIKMVDLTPEERERYIADESSVEEILEQVKLRKAAVETPT